MRLPVRTKTSVEKRRSFKFESLETRALLDGGGLNLERFESSVEVEEYLVSDAIDRYSGLFGQPAWGGWWGPIFFDACPMCDALPGAPERDVLAGGEVPDHSQTNTQVAGVDEADLTETDGNFIYTLAGQELIIADAWQPNELGVVSRVSIEGVPIGQYLNGDRLTVISSDYGYTDYLLPPRLGGAPLIDIVPFGPYIPSTPTTRLTVLDVSDRANPQPIQTTDLDGSYSTSRAIGDKVYVVANSQFGLPAPEMICADAEAPNVWDESCVYETQDAYLERVQGHVLELGTPQYTTVNSSGQEVAAGALLQPTDIYRPAVDAYGNLITVSVLDTSAPDAGTSSIGIPSSYASTIYASRRSIYLTNQDWGTVWGEKESTAILKVDIVDAGSRVELVASGKVPGRLLNSFSMDEYQRSDGNTFFHVATTESWGDDSVNRVYVMQQNDDAIEVLGQTEALAPGEQIFSVRYQDATAYVVTFRQTDPLYTIDLSDPANPTVLGELKITGFSNYLQKVDDHYMIGLGREADPNTGRAQELQVTLFNVADHTLPTLVDRFSFEVPGWAWSEAISDHHAVGYYPEHQILTIPVSNDGWVSIDRDGNGVSDFEMYRPRTELYVFHLNLPAPDGGANTNAGIEFLGTIQHDSDVRRSVRIEDFLYSIANNSISVHSLQDLKTEIAGVHFGQEDVGVPVFDADVSIPTVGLAVESPETTAPQVVHVSVSGSRWHPNVVNYLDGQTAEQPLTTLPFATADQVKVQFSEDVLVGVNDIRISGASRSYGISAFDYDVETRTATWTISEPFTVDTVNIRVRNVRDVAGNRLDGDADGRAGGSFTYQFLSLPGDVDGDGRVDRADWASARSRGTAGSADPAYSISHDVDGNGRVDSADVDAIANLAGTLLPDVAPRVVGDVTGDGRFDSSDLVLVMQTGKYRSGDFARFEDGDWDRDGLFDESDLVFAFQQGTYESAPLAAVAADSYFESLADDGVAIVV